MEGNGKLFLKEENIYVEGLWKGGNIKEGRIYFPNGDIYEGSLEQSLFEGKGTLYFQDGTIYKGNFIKGQRTGNGVQLYPDGSKYVGEFENGLFHGKGEFTWSCGVVYTEEFEYSQLQGNGIIVNTKSKSEYKGMFYKNYFHGKGVYVYGESGAVYDGEYEMGIKKGKGVFIKKDEFVILINTGLEKDRDNLLDYLDQLGITEIDYLIITNRDDKYIGNASYIVKHFKVEYLYINDYEYTSNIVNNLFDELLDSYTEKIVLTSNEVITLGDLVVNVYSYLEDEFTMEDKSFIINAKEGENSIYLTYNASRKRLDFNCSSLLVSENDDLYDVNSKYYVYDGDKKIEEKDNLLKRNLIIYMNEKELIVE